LPEHLVREDLRARRLVKIRVEAWGEDEHKLYLSAVYRGDVTFGPAHRWLFAQLEHLRMRGSELARAEQPRQSRPAKAPRRTPRSTKR
jgi:hypothetical protein